MRVAILVEGLTEEAFINRVVSKYLISHNVSVTAYMVTTKEIIGLKNIQGGGDATKIIADVRRLLQDTSFEFITTLFDFYGFPARLEGSSESDYTDPQSLQIALARLIGDARFYPYLQRHEFETLLFSDPDITASSARLPTRADLLRQEMVGFESIEDINNGLDTAPSKRIKKALNSFSKSLHGPRAAEAIGLDRIRVAAPVFNSWMNWLENPSPYQLPA